MGFQEISNGALAAGVSLDSVRDEWATCALPWLHIHSPSQSSRSSSPGCLSYSCNRGSTLPTSALCGFNFQSTYITVDGRWVICLVVSDLQICTWERIRNTQYIQYTAELNQPSFWRLQVTGSVFLYNMQPENIAAIVLVCHQWRSTVQCAIRKSA